MDDLKTRLRSVPLCSGCGEYPGGVIAQSMDIAADRIATLERQVAAADKLAEQFQLALEELQECTLEMMSEDYNCPDHNAALVAYEATKEQSDA